ncbi:hypothetical protein BDY24DRAFT_178256 [Mrakia frigida]|uniref:zinc finger CCHC-type containing 10 n=1 Tax=Mrakia frigida TaxID=29902 RepID=UPI003FCC0EDC
MLKRVSMDKGRGEGKKLGLGGCGGEEGRCEATRLRPSSKSKAGRGSGKVPSTTTSDVYTKMYPGARKSKATAATKCQVSPASLVWKEEGSRQRRRARVPFSPSLPPLPFPSVLSLSTSLTSSAYTHSAYSLLPVQRIQKCLHTGHYTYECKNDRPYAARPTRTQQLVKPSKREKPSVEVPEEFLSSSSSSSSGSSSSSSGSSSSGSGSDSDSDSGSSSSGSDRSRTKTKTKRRPRSRSRSESGSPPPRQRRRRSSTPAEEDVKGKGKERAAGERESDSSRRRSRSPERRRD